MRHRAALGNAAIKYGSSWNRVGDFLEVTAGQALRYLVFLHYGWAWKLASMVDGTDSEAKAAAVGYVRVPWFSTATDSARHFW